MSADVDSSNNDWRAVRAQRLWERRMLNQIRRVAAAAEAPDGNGCSRKCAQAIHLSSEIPSPKHRLALELKKQGRGRPLGLRSSRKTCGDSK